ncbi:hypothetical protein [Pontibacter mangrovi]|uniref:Uncharacterized protein n=1 Tax=Pontibacter mangrovi TaxID=2589816 RepID=A0A501WAL6_9BACT|nr:hypothetical protein [Pontibacter mangrovi]TPE45852.1 hypothetical protein FJM65_00450 [Pontibacter mangrovi]
MNLDELKQSWQHAGAEEQLRTAQLHVFTKIAHHPVLGRIRIKLLLEALAIVAFLLLFYDGFDGDTKPAYASVVLVLSGMFYLASNLYGFFTLQRPVGAGGVLVSLQQFLSHLQRAKAFSLTSLVLLAVSLAVFFTSAVALDAKRLLLMAGMAAVAVLFLYFSARQWAWRISKIRQAIAELEK